MQLNFDEEAVSVQPVDPNVDTSQRVNASDKRMINATTDVNQLVPFKYKWAWQMYNDSCNNHWMPQEYKMDTDAAQIEAGMITPFELKRIERTVGAMVQTVGAAGSLAMNIYRHITAPEARQYILRQGFEEALVPHAYAHIVERLKLNEDVLLDPANQPTSFHDKQRYAQLTANVLGDPKFRTDTSVDAGVFVLELVTYTCAMKGLFSIVDFTRILAHGLQNELPDLVQQFSLMLRDQQTQVEFGLEVIQAIRNENPQIWTTELVDLIRLRFKEAVSLEAAHAIATALPEDTVPAHQYSYLLQHVANRMASKLGLGTIFQPQANPFPWMAHALGLQESRQVTSAPVENKVSTTLDWE
jgi:ribonucleoside-diphosphate reductase beta chain